MIIEDAQKAFEKQSERKEQESTLTTEGMEDLEEFCAEDLKDIDLDDI